MMDKLQKFCVISLTQGGCHADNTVDLQEFMIMPVGAAGYADGLRMGTEIYHVLKTSLKERGLATGVGDEGGFAPDLPDADAVLSLICEAVQRAGYELEKDVVLALDVAASELYQKESGRYYFPGESRLRGQEVSRDTGQMITYLEQLCSRFPIRSIEERAG